MCDTVLASPATTASRHMLFGKNSDRQRNEAQIVEQFSGAEYSDGTIVRCTYIAIPQARKTHSVVLCRPHWIWGAEMGANEYGLVIGNEGLQARTASPETPALTGMDLIRLALERTATAEEAVDLITQLLEKYGQGGNCGHLDPAYYNNGFMIADPNSAFVLETVNSEWLVRRVNGVHAISNCYSIGEHPDRVSRGIAALAESKGGDAVYPVDYSNLIADKEKEFIGQANLRRQRSTRLLEARRGNLTLADMFSILRDHGAKELSVGDVHSEETVKRTPCLHALTRNYPAQTTGSMVSELAVGGSSHWVTGTAAPCISIFKPTLLDVPLPVHGASPGDHCDLESLWWRHERLHRRALMGDFAQFQNEIRGERDLLEGEFRSRIWALSDEHNAEKRSAVISRCWRDASEMEDRWFQRLSMIEPSFHGNIREAWLEYNRIAGLELLAIEGA